MGTATAPDRDRAAPGHDDHPPAPVDGAPPDPDMGFVNHAFHLGLPRAQGTDTWGHAALWRNPAARQAAPDWAGPASAGLTAPHAGHPVAAPQHVAGTFAGGPREFGFGYRAGPPGAYTQPRAHEMHHPPPQGVPHANGHAFVPALHGHGLQAHAQTPMGMQGGLGMQQAPLAAMPHHHPSMPMHHAQGHRRKQWAPHAAHGMQNPAGPAPRRGRHARGGHSQAPGGLHNGLSMHGRGGGRGGISGGANGTGGGSVPSVREFNRRISACARRRDLAGALRVLDELDRTPAVSRNLFTYNAVINALVMCAQHAKARELWTEMQESGIDPNLVTYNTMMKSCFGGTDEDVERAFALVKEMEHRGIAADRVTLNSLINACVTAGLLHDAQRVYEQMRQRNIEPDDFTFTTLAKAGASQNNVAMLDALLVHQLHHHSTARSRAAAEGGDPSANGHGGKNNASSTHRTSPVAYNTIADAYIRCGHPERALRLLSRLRDLHILTRNIPPGGGPDPLDGDTIPVHPDVQTFNVILKALREAGAPAVDAFQLLHQLKILGLEADHITLLTLADLCCRREEMALAEGVLHAATEADVREFEKGSSEWRSLCNRTTARDVQRSFQSGRANGGALHSSQHNNAVNVPGTSSGRRNVNQPRNAKANAALFNSLIRGYSSLDPPNVDAAVALYREMQRYLELYGFTWYAADFVTYTMLVDGFARVGDAARAESIISEMENAGRANVVAYNAYMKANRASGFKAAVLVLERMKRVGLRPDVVTYNTIIDLLCSEENGAALAEELVRVDMPRNGVRPDLLTFNTLIKGAARVRGSRSDAGAALGAAYRWLRELQARGLHPDEFTYQSMVSACAAAGDAPRALEFFRKVEAERAKRSGHASDYGMAGSPDERWQGARNKDARAPASGSPPGGARAGKDWMLLPHPAAYIALMRAFLTSNGKHGVANVLLLRDEMVSRGLELGKQGYSAVADAYAERGEFAKVEETLAEMLRKERAGTGEAGLGPVHHCIRMKALCNADRLEEAIAILPEVESPDAAVFNVLITACARGKDMDRLMRIVRAMEEAGVDPDAITSRAISGMMRNVAKTLRSYDQHVRDLITRFAAGNAVGDGSIPASAGLGAGNGTPLQPLQLVNGGGGQMAGGQPSEHELSAILSAPQQAAVPLNGHPVAKVASEEGGAAVSAVTAASQDSTTPEELANSAFAISNGQVAVADASEADGETPTIDTLLNNISIGSADDGQEGGGGESGRAQPSGGDRLFI